MAKAPRAAGRRRKPLPTTSLNAKVEIAGMGDAAGGAQLVLSCIEAIRGMVDAHKSDHRAETKRRQLKRELERAGLEKDEVVVRVRTRPVDANAAARKVLGNDAPESVVAELVDAFWKDDRGVSLLSEHDECVLLASLLDFVVVFGSCEMPTWYDVILACGAQEFEPLPPPTKIAWKERGRNWTKRRNRGREWTGHRLTRLMRARGMRIPPKGGAPRR